MLVLAANRLRSTRTVLGSDTFSVRGSDVPGVTLATNIASQNANLWRIVIVVASQRTCSATGFEVGIFTTLLVAKSRSNNSKQYENLHNGS
jgi:hypothetical protein